VNAGNTVDNTVDNGSSKSILPNLPHRCDSA